MRIGRTAAAVVCALLCAGACSRSPVGETLPTHTTPATSVPSSPHPAGAAYDDPATVATVLAAARADLPIVTGYDYRHLDEDTAKGLAVSTGSFSAQYEAAMRDTVASLAVSSRTVQSTQVAEAGLVWLTSGKAEVLIFGQQTVTNKSTTSPRLDVLTAGVELTLTGGMWKVSSVRVGSSDQADPPGTKALKAAVAAGDAQATAMLTYRRHSFAQDAARAEAGATGTLLDSIRRDAATLRAQMQQGGFDLRGEIAGAGTVSVSPDHIVLLVAALGYKDPDSGAETLQTRTRFQVDLVDVGGTWRADDVKSVGLV